MKKLNFSIVFLYVFFMGCTDVTYPDPQNIDTSFMVISDVHYMDSSLLKADGAAFQNYLAADRKMLKESSAIIQSVLETIKAKKPSFLLISGDLTKDGEKISHTGLAKMLKEVEKSGIQVFVINGNHDVNNAQSVEYNGDFTTPVSNITAEEFVSIYADFGYSEAIERDKNSLSYVCEPINGLRILALDACHYYPLAETSGSLKSETLEWAVNQIKQAKLSGKRIIGMMHHGLLEHYQGQKQLFGAYIISDYQSVAKKLSSAGLEIIFTGHFHAQDISSLQIGNNLIYDIETGSIVTSPCPYREVTFQNKIINVNTGKITSINYPLPGGKDFQTYAKDYLKEKMSHFAMSMLINRYNVPQEYSLKFAPVIANAFVAHYQGDKSPSEQDEKDMQDFINYNHTLGNSFNALWYDLSPADNRTTITLNY